MPRKIRFWRTVGDSYGFVFGDWGRLFRHSAAWVALGAVIAVAAMILFGPEVLNKPQSPALLLSTGRAVTTVALGVFQIASYVAFSVGWHRAVLLGDGHATALDALRFKRREFRFLLYIIAVGLVWIGVALAGSIIVFALTAAATSGQSILHSFEGKPSGGFAIAVAALFLGVFVALPFLARLTLGLPAIAVEEPRGVFGRSWHRGWGNGWRLIWGPVFCSLPLNIVAGLFSAGQVFFVLVADYDPPWREFGLVGTIAFYVLGSFAHFIALAGAISFLSLSYRQLSAGEVET
ncbi:MAG TPA: hypothetical protein VN632_08615 [Stellaceae bacterium]|nr:hypothetical protein [Stellaceae bacterium]